MTIDVADFQRDVLARSHQEPVVVDFWAAWCGPCRVLGPVLERLAHEANGAWTLAKLDTEALPDVAARFGIRSIPTIKIFVDGRPTAEFTGALPEKSVRQWLEKVLPSKHRADVDHAEAFFASGDEGAARAIVEGVLAQEPDNLKARILEAQILLFEDPDRAAELLAGLEEHVEDFQKVDSVRTLAALLTKAKDVQHLPESPVKARYEAALQEVTRKHFDAALRHFIHIIREDRYYDDDGSRKACIAIFKYLGETHEVTLKHRREFSSALY
jgi:putative thioredoxin